MIPSRQTITYLMRRFNEAGIRPDVRHGQNFLIDLNLLDLLVNAAKIGPQDVVLEVGTGLGSLTARLASLAAAVVTVEIDARLYQLATEELTDCTNVTILLQDALRTKNSLDSRLVEALKLQLAAGPNRQLKLAANLPYNVATPILSNLLMFDPVPVSLTATIQKELAERLVAVPGVKDYSALSIWMQAICDVEIVRVMSPTVFWPQPKVHSAIVQITPNAEKRARILDLEFFHQFVRNLFLHRRKFLRGVLANMLKEQLEKPTVDEILQNLAFPVGVRAEQLDVSTMLQLCEAVRKRTSVAV